MTFQTDNLFGYSTGVSYCQLGALEERTTYGLISRLDYINVPLLLNLRLSKRTYAPILKTGVRLGFLVGAKFSDDMGSIQPDNGLSANSKRSTVQSPLVSRGISIGLSLVQVMYSDCWILSTSQQPFTEFRTTMIASI